MSDEWLGRSLHGPEGGRAARRRRSPACSWISWTRDRRILDSLRGQGPDGSVGRVEGGELNGWRRPSPSRGRVLGSAGLDDLQEAAARADRGPRRCSGRNAGAPVARPCADQAASSVAAADTREGVWHPAGRNRVTAKEQTCPDSSWYPPAPRGGRRHRHRRQQPRLAPPGQPLAATGERSLRPAGPGRARTPVRGAAPAPAGHDLPAPGPGRPQRPGHLDRAGVRGPEGQDPQQHLRGSQGRHREAGDRMLLLVRTPTPATGQLDGLTPPAPVICGSAMPRGGSAWRTTLDGSCAARRRDATRPSSRWPVTACCGSNASRRSGWTPPPPTCWRSSWTGSCATRCCAPMARRSAGCCRGSPSTAWSPRRRCSGRRGQPGCWSARPASDPRPLPAPLALGARVNRLAASTPADVDGPGDHRIASPATVFDGSSW